jgi:predicted ATPase
MLIAVSGSQGSGKSTILAKLEEQGFNTVSRKTSRSILSEWDVSLEQVNNDRDLTLKFQDEIILRKKQDEANAAASDELWFTERTYADLFTYSLISLGKDNRNNDFLNRYYRTCLGYQQTYSHVFYLRAGYFDIEHDGTRGSNRHYSRMADLIMKDYTEQMTLGQNLSVIETPDLQERVDLISVQAYNIKTNKIK